MCNLLGRLQVVAYVIGQSWRVVRACPQRAGLRLTVCGGALRTGAHYLPLSEALLAYISPFQGLTAGSALFPGRCPGLRYCGPLGRRARPEGPGYLSPAQRAGNIFNQTACGLKGRDTSLTKTACGAMGDALISANHAPISISNSCSSHLQHKKSCRRTDAGYSEGVVSVPRGGSARE